MKKITSLLMAVLMLATILTVFAVPASAETLNGDMTYEDYVVITENTTVLNGSNLVFDSGLEILPTRTLTIEAGASVTVNEVLHIKGNLTIQPGGTFSFSTECNISPATTIDVSGMFAGKWREFTPINNVQNITLLPGGVIEIMFADRDVINTFLENFKGFKATITEIEDDDDCRYLVTVENDCDLTASVLSSGYPWIIVAIAAVVLIGGVAALVIVMKKKKAAVADGENTDEE